jgi:hypothetical protein
VGNSNVVLANAGNVFGAVHGNGGGSIQVRGLTGVSSSNLSAAQSITLENTVGVLQIDGDVVASGATSSVSLTGGGGVVVQGSLVQGGSGGVLATSTGAGVQLLGSSVITSGDVTLVGSGNAVIIDGSLVRSTAADVSIAGTPFSAGQPAIEVRATGSSSSSVLAANTVQMSGGGVLIEANDASVKVEGNVVDISTSNEALTVTGSSGVAGATAKLLATNSMTLNLGSGDLTVQGGAAANAYALVGGTAGSASVNINTGFVNLLGGTGTGSYAGLIKVGGDLTTAATLNLVPDLSTGGGVLVAANNFSALTINPVGATPVLYAALTVDPNTGIVSDAGTPFAVTGIVAGGGVALPPVVPGESVGTGTADINQSFLALLLQNGLQTLGPDSQLPQNPEQRAAQNPDDVVAEAEICR